MSEHSKKPLPPKLDPNARLLRVGGDVDEVRISLRIMGDDLEPEDVTGLLGHPPTTAHRKGEVLPDRRYHRVAKTGLWSLEGSAAREVPFEAQVRELLMKLSHDPSAWGELTRRFELDLFCGLFLREFNRGFILSADLMRMLADRGIDLGCDIYGPIPDDHPIRELTE